MHPAGLLNVTQGHSQSRADRIKCWIGFVRSSDLLFLRIVLINGWLTYALANELQEVFENYSQKSSWVGGLSFNGISEGRCHRKSGFTVSFSVGERMVGGNGFEPLTLSV